MENSWEFLIAGEPMSQLSKCVDISKSGELVVSSNVWEIIGQSGTWEQKEDVFLLKELSSVHRPDEAKKEVQICQGKGVDFEFS